MDDISRFRAETVGILRLPAHRNRKQRTTVEGIMEGNNLGFVRTVTRRGVITRQLKGGFIGFGAGVHEQHTLGKGGVDYLTPQTQRRFVGEHVAGVPQGFALGFQRFNQRRMAVPQRRHRNTAREINVLFTLLIPNPTAFPFDRDKLRRCINRQNHFIECCARNCRLFSCHVIPVRFMSH
ncbi:hypothetical protein D3C71_833570 [compost metagenome]